MVHYVAALTSSSHESAGVEWIDDDSVMFAPDRAMSDQPYIIIHCVIAHYVIVLTSLSHERAGVEWIDDDRLMLASDRAKADQPYICTRRDQSVHIMVLPYGHRKVEGAFSQGIATASAA